MIWNFLKSIFWCGIFHKPKPCVYLEYECREPTREDIGKDAVCQVCGTVYEII